MAEEIRTKKFFGVISYTYVHRIQRTNIFTHLKCPCEKSPIFGGIFQHFTRKLKGIFSNIFKDFGFHDTCFKLSLCNVKHRGV